MAGTEQKDYEQIIRHFQSINAANVTNTINIVLTLAVGVTAFAVNILVSAKAPLGGAASWWLIISLALLLTSVLSGIVLFLNRIEDFRLTIDGAVMQRDNPTGFNEEQVKRAILLMTRADRTNGLTRLLLYVQPAMFLCGFICLGVSVLLTHGGNLK